jgi:hypothetical protein
VETAICDDSLDPTWDDDLELPGYYPGTDVLRVELHDEDDDPRGAPCLGMHTFPSRDMVPFGVPSETEMNLIKTDRTGKVAKDATEVGTIFIYLHIAQLDDEPFVAAPWVNTFKETHVTLIGVTGAPLSALSKSRGHSELFLKAHTKQSLDSQLQRTKTSFTGLDPTWEEDKHYYINGWDDVLVVQLFDCTAKSEEQIAEVEIPFKDFSKSDVARVANYTMARAGSLAKQPGTTVLQVRVTIEGLTKSIEPKPATKENPKPAPVQQRPPK